MAFKGYILCCILLLLGSFVHGIDDAFSKTSYATYDSTLLNRTSFPKGFVFGTGSASYQYEGAAYEDGKRPNIWDTYTHKHPDRISDKSNGDVALDSYHRYQEDINIMKEMGTDAYRFSISWARLLPKGKPSGGINKLGIQHYNNVINKLLAHGIQPYVTLFHWDLPQALEDEYGGFLSPHIVDDFRDYADVCFKAFGDRVKHWFTLNEPWTFSNGGYAGGTLAPGRCSAWQGLNCTGGDSATEPYVVSHNQLLAHAAAVKLYKEKYKATQKGAIGITLVSHWMIPASGAKHNINAALRSLDFMLGWFLDPLVYGDYPHSMRSYVGRRLPKFTKEQSMMVKGSFDYIGINYYTAYYASYSPNSNNPKSYTTDPLATLNSFLNGVAIGTPSASSWLYSYPRGIRDLLLYVKNKYKNPVIYITENGVDEFNNSTLPLEQQLADPMRIDYYYHHLRYLRQAIMEGINVKGYFAWSLLDNFEWSSGYTVRFGVNYVDFKNGLKRYPKHSSLWFKSFLRKHH